MRREFPKFLHDRLASVPRAGEGVHSWLFCISRQLHAHLPAGDIVKLLEERTVTCGRRVPRSEIVEAVQNSLACAWEPNSSSQQPSVAKWPMVNHEQREAVIQSAATSSPLQKVGAVPVDQWETETIVDRLFPGDPMLCVGKSASQFITKPRERWRGQLDRHQFIVPSPMSDLTGLTKKGVRSAHTLNNTGPRRFLVVEFDIGTAEEHEAILLHLASFAPLVCALHSGGKSTHGWFFVCGQPEEKVLKFFRYAVSLGADYATWTRSQFVRIPGGLRDNGKRQHVVFLNFKPLEVAHE